MFYRSGLRFEGPCNELPFYVPRKYISFLERLRHEQYCHQCHIDLSTPNQRPNNARPAAHVQRPSATLLTPNQCLNNVRPNIYIVSILLFWTLFLPLFISSRSPEMPKPSHFTPAQSELLQAKLPDFMQAVNKHDPHWKGNCHALSKWLKTVVEDLLLEPAFATFEGFQSKAEMAKVRRFPCFYLRQTVYLLITVII